MEGMRLTRAAKLKLKQQKQQKQKQRREQLEEEPTASSSSTGSRVMNLRTRHQKQQLKQEEQQAPTKEPAAEPTPVASSGEEEEDVKEVKAAASEPEETCDPVKRESAGDANAKATSNTHNGQLTEYERKRLENIQRNLEFMKSIGVSTAKIAARTAASSMMMKRTSTTSTVTSTSASSSAARHRRPAPVPTRQSLRIRGIEAQQQEISSSDKRTVHDAALAHALYESERKRGRFDANLDAQALNLSSESNRSLLESIVAEHAEASDDEESLQVDSTGVDLVDYQLAEQDVIKAVPERIYSMAFHPRKDKVVLACADKGGRIALWSAVDADKNSSSTSDSSDQVVAMYRPHSLPVSSMGFLDSNNTNKLFSSSYDGSIREFDLQAAKFTELFATDSDIGITYLTRNSAFGAFLMSCDNGFVHMVDVRAGAGVAQASSYFLHEKKVNTVHQHPAFPYCIATASLDRTVCLWDLRRVKTSHSSSTSAGYLVKMPHFRSVNCAYFSPHGDHLVTVCQDDNVFLYDTKTSTHKDVDNVRPTLKIPHCNKTGRWLTKFHASWDPKKSSQFVVGSMQHPRRIQLFEATRRQPIQELTSDLLNSVHSINVFHPSLELLAGGNSSGRVCLWRKGSQ